MPPEVFIGDNEFIFSVCLDVLFDVGSDGRRIAIELGKGALWWEREREGFEGWGPRVRILRGWTKPAASDKSIALRDA
jgi:hypothetical protein